MRDEQPQIEDLIQVPEPEQVETPQDAFAGIDMLISTPESVEDIRQQYEEAKAKMETAVEEARKANAEKMRLEKLLDRLEKNVEPEMKARHTDSTDDTAQEAVSVVPVSTETSSEETKRQEAFNRVMVEPPHSEEPEPQPKKTSKKRLWLTLLIILLVAILGVFIYLIHQNIEAVEKVTVTEKTAQPAKPAKPAKPTQPATPKVDKDSLAKAQQADSIKAAPQQSKARGQETRRRAATRTSQDPQDATRRIPHPYLPEVLRHQGFSPSHPPHQHLCQPRQHPRWCSGEVTVIFNNHIIQVSEVLDSPFYIDIMRNYEQTRQIH